MVPDYQISQDPDVQQFFENVLNSSLQYFSELIDINHINYVTESQFYCSDYYSENSIDMGDADVLLIISNSSQGNYLVLGGTCYLDTQDNKAPNIMYLKVQTYIIEQVYDIYQENGVNGGLYYQYLRSINHEIFHNLAFRVDYFSNYPNYDYSSQVYDFLDTKPRGYPTLAMITEKVKKEVQDFFGCPNYEGMQLENSYNNQQNAYIEHLESTIFGNNLMSYLYILEPRGFSRVELAILDDSNWYNSINYDLADVYYWGKDKGCDFLENSCIELQNKFEEFQTKQFGCSFDYKSKAIQASQYKKGQYNFYTDNCDFMYSYLPCNTGIYNQDSSAELYESFQTNSRCFESTLRNEGEQIQTISQRCYDSSCNEDGTIVYIHLNSNIKLECYMNNQIIDIDNINGVEGAVLCPNDIKRFCADINTCENLCSKNGYCVQNKCRCLKGYGGKTCQQKCQSGEFVYEDNGNSVCINSGCPQGYYLDTNQYSDNDVYTCLECFKGCSECANSKSDQCTACFSGYTLDSGKCKKNCISNSNCLECDGKDNCIQCQSGYLLQNNECKQECDDGFYEKNGVCLQCPLESNCQICEYDNVNSKVVCLSCIQNQFNDVNIYYFIFDGICVIDCPNGYYNDGQDQCFECHTSCSTCDGPNAYNCLSCQNGQFLYKKQCLDDCPIGYFSSNGKCQTILCKDNYVIKNGVCVKECGQNQFLNKIENICYDCNSSCKTCVDYADKCTSCQDADKILKDYQCNLKIELNQQLSEISSQILQNNTKVLILIISLLYIII